MGLDVPDIRQIIHWGPSDDFESYIEETGKARRDDDLCCALLYHTPRDYRVISKEMIDYCTNTTICKRQLLFSDFEGCDVSVCCQCYCRNICMSDCGCSINAITSSFYM